MSKEGAMEKVPSDAALGASSPISSSSAAFERARSNKVHEDLMQWSRRIITFLNNLAPEELGSGVVQERAAMPHQAFYRAKALEFVFRKKFGVLLSYQTEYGFLTRKIVHEDGSISWSAPIFTKGRSLGVGFTIGRQSSGMCLALMNDEAVHNALKARGRVAFKGQFLIDMDGTYIRPIRLDSRCQADNVIVDADGGMLAKYFRMEALMIDFSLEFVRVRLSSKKNKRIYGDIFEIETALDGTLAPPSELNGVFDYLNRLVASGRLAAKKSRRAAS